MKWICKLSFVVWRAGRLVGELAGRARCASLLGWSLGRAGTVLGWD